MAGTHAVISRLMRGVRLRYAGAIAAMLLATVFSLLVPLIGKGAIDYVIAGRPLDAPRAVRRLVEQFGGLSMRASDLWAAAVLMVSLSGLAGAFSYLRGRWTSQASETVARRLRDRLYDHLQRLACSYHDRAETGDLVQRCTSDVETVRQFLGVQIVEIARAVTILCVALPIMLLLDWRMTLVAMAALPLIVGGAVFFFSRVKSAFKLSDEAEGRMTTVLQENLTGIRVVRAFARQDHECAKFAERNAAYRDRTFHMIRLMAWYWSSSDLLCHVQNGLVLIVGATWVLSGRITVGTLVVFTAYESMFLWPLRQMGRILTDLGKAQVALGRIGEVLDQPDEEGVRAGDGAGGPPSASQDGTVPASPDGIAAAGSVGPAVPPLSGHIVFRDLAFSYGGGADVLNGVSFEVRPGRTVALLGHSGSGKSTLVHLLLRLYDYERGSIRLDGRELRTMDRRAVRSRIGSVLQEPFLYSRTLRENIGLGGGSQVDEERIVRAASAAAMHEAIAAFEQGYDTVVGERGVTLSGGQRQRVALARAILRDPPVLLLDDALSAVDTRTEALILDALRARRGHATTLVIAHRLSTLAQADHIVVLDRGRVAQQGTHEELLARQGLYRRLWQIQSSLEEDLDRDLRAG